jgi:DNA-binding LytR/AlgR family response regulator
MNPQNISCIIVEDEPPAIKVLKNYAQKMGELDIVGIYQNPLEALQVLRQTEVDLLFLDINLPDLSGIELLKSLKNPPKVIFTTAYSEFALEGFELQITDFLLKPYSFDRFVKAIHKVLQEIETEKKLQEWSAAKEADVLIIKADRKIYRLPFEDILHLQAYGDYVKIQTTDKQLVPKETLNKLETLLPEDQFIRIHRSCIVALNKVEYVEGNLVHIRDKNIPIGKSFREEFLKRIQGG